MWPFPLSDMMDDHTQENFGTNNTAINNLYFPPGVNTEDDIVILYDDNTLQFYTQQEHQTPTHPLPHEGYRAPFTLPQRGGGGGGGGAVRRRRARGVTSEPEQQQQQNSQQLFSSSYEHEYSSPVTEQHHHHHHHHHQQQQQQRRQQQQYEEEDYPHPRLPSPLDSPSDDVFPPPPSAHAPDSPRHPPHPRRAPHQGQQRGGRDRSGNQSRFPLDFTSELYFWDLQK